MRIFQLTDDNFIEARKYRKILLDFFDVCENEEPEIFIPIESELIASSDEENSFEASTPINKKSNKNRLKVKCQECGKLISSTSVGSHKSLHKYKNLGRAYLCPLCTFNHPFKSHLIVHIKRSHKNENLNFEQIKPTFCLQSKVNLKQVDRVKCEKCNQMILKSHMRKHKILHTHKKTKVKCKIIS